MQETITLAVRRQRLLDWVWAGIGTTVAQAGIQALGFAAGVLVIRLLSPREYAFYTIATAGLGMMTVLSDGGVASGALALGGAVWQDPVRLGVVIATGIRFRRLLARFALAIGLPLMVMLLRRQGASWTESALVCLSVVPALQSTLTSHLLEVVPRLHQKLRVLQLLQMAAGACRLVLVAAILPWWPAAVIANLIAALTQWLANLRLRKLVTRHSAWRVPGTEEVADRMKALVRRTMPGSIYYALSGQLSVGLLALFGKSDNVAAVGGLARPAMVFTVVSLAFGAMAIPRFARIPASQRSLVHARYHQSQLVLMAICLLVLALLVAFSDPVLAILGPTYKGLHRELALMGVSFSTAILAGAAYGLGLARGIVVPATISIPLNLLVQIAAIAWLPLNTVAGVLWIGILSGLGQWLVYLAYFELRFRNRAATSL
jgi:O-antigen/teichoic acid export membrane protein